MKKTTLLLDCFLARRAGAWAALGLLSALVSGSPPAQAAVTEAWVHRYSNVVSNSDDQALKVVRDAAGDIIVTGYTDDRITGLDMLTIKYSGADGSVLWQKRYNGPANSADIALAVAVDGSRNVVVTGYSYNSSGNMDYYTAKYAAADGALLWEQRYNEPAPNTASASAVAVDGSGNVVVTGTSSRSGSRYDFYTAKYAAADGALLWEKRYNGPANYVDGASAVAVDGSGNVVVTGASYGTNFNYDYYTAKYAAADGALLWEQRYNGPANSSDEARVVAVDASGNVIVTGSSVGTGVGSYDRDYYTAKYAAADGALLLEMRYNGPANFDDRAQTVGVDGSGNVLVSGYSRGSGSGDDYYTAKYAAVDGALLWEQRHTNTSSFFGSYTKVAMAVDGSGNVVVTGNSEGGGPNHDNDYYTAKYAAADGALLWEKRYNGPANGEDFASSIALGPNGMVAVTGSSSGDYATVVYWENLPPVSIALVPTGVRLRFTGVPSRSYTIERAPAVTGPWTTLNTQTAPASGLLEYLDAPPPAGSAFYRSAQP